MTTEVAPDVERYWEALKKALPVFNPEEQRAAVALYRELGKGEPVGVHQLAEALDVSPAQATELLQRPPIQAFIYPDAHGRVLGFGGLAVTPMHHTFRVNGRTLWTWCAWDSLFIPELLGATAHVESPDPESGEVVTLVVEPGGVTSVQPNTAVVSFLMPDAADFDDSAANVMAKFCHFVFFFAARGSGELWVARHPGTFLYPIEDAMTLAKRLNERNFGHELERRSTMARPTVTTR